MTVALLVLTSLVAVADWGAVVRARRRVEAIAKPLTLLLLIAAAGSADLGTAKPWVLLALGLGLLGDVALVYARERPVPVAGGAGHPDAAFMIGLGCFLLGHLSYLVAFTRHGLHPWQVLAGALVAVGTGARVMPRLLHAAGEDGAAVAFAVGVYAVALAAMTSLGFGTAAIGTAVGALLFLGSDTTLAWDRFVTPLQRGPIIVVVTYHVAQILIVIGLIR